MSDEPRFEEFTLDLTFAYPDPDLLGLLTGGVIRTPPPPTFAVEVVTPIKRTFWQWLRRRPVQHMRYVIPHARLAPEEEEER